MLPVVFQIMGCNPSVGIEINQHSRRKEEKKEGREKERGRVGGGEGRGEWKEGERRKERGEEEITQGRGSQSADFEAQRTFGNVGGIFGYHKKGKGMGVGAEVLLGIYWVEAMDTSQDAQASPS